LAGIRVAKGKRIVTMDDDLQHPPEEIGRLLMAMDESRSDVVYGTPIQINHSVVRKLASVITKVTLKGAMGVQSARNVSAFRIFKGEACKCFLNFRGGAVNIDVMLTWGTNKFSSIPVMHDKRRYGKTRYTPSKLISHAFNMITGFSTLPLQVASFLGIGIGIFGGFILLYVIYNYIINGSTVPGFVFIVCIISLFSGAQLLALGVIGEYLSRVYERTSDKPAFLVSESIGIDIQQ
jgi:undecaprenyl-phosphate 4-deoxy-4-formamido-L-arabinose transferase